MTERHKDIVQQVRSFGEFPEIWIKEILPNGYRIRLVSTERPKLGGIVAADYDLADLLAIVRGVDIGDTHD